jgi:hypothetical protein
MEWRAKGETAADCWRSRVPMVAVRSASVHVEGILACSTRTTLASLSGMSLGPFGVVSCPPVPPGGQSRSSTNSSFDRLRENAAGARTRLERAPPVPHGRGDAVGDAVSPDGARETLHPNVGESRARDGQATRAERPTGNARDGRVACRWREGEWIPYSRHPRLFLA